MKISDFRAIKVLILSFVLWGYAAPGLTASDSARVITTPVSKGPAKAGVKVGKSAVIAIVNLEEIMPDCQQRITKAKIKSVQYSESGITTESITFAWSKLNVTIPTRMGDNGVLSLDDLIEATKFIKAGNTYFIHFQECEPRQEFSLINIYAI